MIETIAAAVIVAIMIAAGVDWHRNRPGRRLERLARRSRERWR